MSMDSESTFRFFPRPEAHAMKWEELMPPVRRAVRDLLLRIDGATRKQAKDKEPKDKEAKACEIAANCFLVHGDRGTGKTTVLLSAKYACESKEEFFGKGEHKQENSAENVRRDAMNRAEELKKNVVWLDVLDLEPLPPRANLLTTVLTRVRNALNLPGSEKPLDETTSILEERADSARNKLKQLINDATLMWEDIHEHDTRSRANRQVAAADIYAQFQKRFQDAMDALSRELGRRSGRADTYLHVVLPIDNIDRSTEHLYSIVKLAQMVFCPRLWLVMAGDRQDVETFLERAYWKELIRIGEEGAGATGKTGVSGEDEALVMARRQAGAASHRLLPPSHRVEVGLVEPEGTLEFKPTGVSGKSEADKNIRELLANVRLITEEELEKETEVDKNIELLEDVRLITEEELEKETEKGRPRIWLIDLFDAQRLIKRVVDQKDKSYYTEAAKLGLRLPARGVLDLWQLAYWVTNDETIPEHREAEKIARTMLRNAITESTMSSKMGRRLQEQIIRRNPQGGTMLDFWVPNWASSRLEMFRLQALEYEFQPSIKVRRTAAGYTLSVIHTKAMTLRLQGIWPSVEGVWPSVEGVVNGHKVMLKFQGVRSSVEGDVDGHSDDQLPDLIAAWLSVLYDALIWGAEDSAVISGRPPSPSAIVSCWHDSAGSAQEWPLPQWMSFISHDIHGQLWRGFLHRLKAAKLLEKASREGSLSRLLVTGWIACVVETFLALAPQGNWERACGILARLERGISCGEHCGTEGMAGAIKDGEKEVMNAASCVYAEILRINVEGTIYRADDETRPMVWWLEGQLPLLLSHLFVPMADGNAKTRAEEIINFLEGKEPPREGEPPIDTALAECWKANWPAILTALENRFKELFQIGDAGKLVPVAVEPFNNLHQICLDPKSLEG